MASEQNRRDFLKQGLAAGTGIICCCINLSCSKQPQKKQSPLTETPQEDFGKLTYCGFICDERCRVFRATKNNDRQAKAKIAKKWSEKYGSNFKPEDVACYGCKTENIPLSQFAQLCDVRKCAREKKVVTCAHCDDFPTCEKDLWTTWPKQKEKIIEIRNKLKSPPKT